MSRLMRAIATLLLALPTLLNSSSLGLAAQDSTPSPFQIVPTPTPTPLERPTSGDTYTDPLYGWSVSWNGEEWNRFLVGDVLELTTTTESGYGWRLTFNTITGVDDAGWSLVDVLDPKSCLVAMESRDVVQQYGAGSIPLREVSRDRAWGIYADEDVQPGNAYYMDCWLIPGKNAMLMIHGFGPIHLFNEIAPRLEALVSQVTIPEPPITHACDSSEELAPSVATDRDGLFALLPHPYMAPQGFDTGTDAFGTFEQAVGAMGGTREASDLLEDLGWTAHVSRAFNNENPSPGSTDALLVSIHGFKDEASATIAFDAYSSYLISVTGSVDVEGPKFCDKSRYLTSTDQYGNVSTSLYVQNGPVLYRLWGVASEGGNPTPELITLATQVFGSSGQSTSPSLSGATIGQPAPDFSMETFSGETFTLSEHRGEVVVMNFWGSWCEPCKRDLELLQAVWVSAPDDVTFVSVGSKRDPEDQAIAFAEEFGVTYPIGRDTDGGTIAAGQISKDYNIVFYPMTYIIDPDGNIVAIVIGEIDEEDLNSYINEARESLE